MRFKSWIRTVPTLVIIGSVLFLVLSVGGGCCCGARASRTTWCTPS